MTYASHRPALPERRRVLALLSGLGLLGVWAPRLPPCPLPGTPRPSPVEGAEKALSLHEADFYRPHDLAG
jgi:hypothetical protein